MAEAESAPIEPDPATERRARLQAWARTWAEQSTPWSDRKWQRVNTDLGYKLRDK